VRNAVDHGLETPEVRLQNGKSRVGHLLLAAQQAGDHIVITISDDGAGIDSNVIRTKAVEKGLVTTDQAARMDTEECLNLIFAPGFSTKAQISDISGRGVGLDVVKTRITQLSGTVEVQSEQGVGTTIIIRLPLTLAILPTLMVRVDGRPFAIPLSSVEDILKLDTLTLRRVDGQDVAMVRDQALPLLFLRDWLLVADSTNQLLANHVVTVHIGSRRMGLVVDDVMGQEEVVIKPLGALLHGLPGYAGATITGDGRIALILDVPGVVASRDNRV
jgi:two-component system chemotaxis sensor kinase CheA